MNMKENKTNCHPKHDLESSTQVVYQQQRQASKIRSQVQDDFLVKHRGFTLIELLIAVLIIGVLAAIAVSAYQKAVLKSRFSSIIPPTKTIADAQEFYYMNNGSYTTDVEALEVTLKNNEDLTIQLSEKDKYKYVMGSHNKADKNHYIVYQKHSPKFADNIHCEAAKDDAKANWLCEKGLGGTLLTGSISGKNYLTYLLAGDGIGNFLRDDCPVGYYDKEGECTKAPAGSYAVEGELKTCPGGTYSQAGKAGCTNCGRGTYSEEGSASCTACPTGWVAPAGSTSCTKCPAGTWVFGDSCRTCPNGMYSEEGATSCTACPTGYVSPAGSTSAASCTKCPAGTWVFGDSCKTCPNGMYSEEGATSCTACPTGYVSPAGSTSAASCTKCPAGTWVFGDSCKTCPNGMYSEEGATSCTACPEGTTSNADRTGCVPK